MRPTVDTIPERSEKTKILLVDDRPDGLMAIEAVLARPDYELVKAGSGREALRRLLHEDFAVILLDVQMPEMDGFETASIIKMRERSRDTPIIFVTAISKDDHYIFKGYQAGAVDYIFKPFNPHTLQAKVAVFVDLFRKKRLIQRQADQIREIERKERREEIQRIESENELRFHHLADAIPQILLWASPAKKLEYVNRSWSEFTGMNLTDSCGDAWQTAIHADDLEALLEAWRLASAEGGSFEIECRLRQQPHRYAWHLIRGVPERDTSGAMTGWLVTATHIDDRKHEELRHRFLAEAGSLLAESLDYRDTAKQITRLGIPSLGEWCAAHLVRPDGSLGLASLSHPDSERAAQVLKFCQENTETSDSVVERSLRRAIASGRPVILQGLSEDPLARLMRLPDHAEAVIAPLLGRKKVLGTLMIISSRKSYSERDGKLLEELAARSGLALANAILYEEAQKAIRSRDEFLSIASHELKTPLTPLKIQTQIFRGLADRGQLASLPPHKLGKMLETSDRQVEKLSSLIEEMLDIARINIGRLTLTPEDFDLGELFAELSDRFAPSARAAGSEIEVEAPGGLLVTWDRFRIEQVMVNLITNAIKYGEAKPIRLSAEALPGNQVRISVRDRGIGIDPADQPRIFERFERAVSAKHFGGLGLGLYIVRQIIHGHSGAIRVESVLGEGSLFIIELPSRLTQGVHHISLGSPTEPEQDLQTGA
jgi:PAS domain S-box-containing protein